MLLGDRDIITHFFKLSGLQSIRDNHFNDAKATLSLFMTENQTPECLKTGAAHLNKWRAQKRLLGLLAEWRDRRFAGDEMEYRREYQKGMLRVQSGMGSGLQRGPAAVAAWNGRR